MNPYLSPSRVRAALRTLAIRPSRGMGQNFLIDPQVLAAIVAAAELDPSNLVVEVGPGLGVLTWELLRSAKCVVSIELDRRLANRLQHEFADAIAAASLRIIQGDILEQSPRDILRQVGGESGAYKVVANLPYAITAPVLRHFLEHTWPPTMMVVLVQYEVGARIVAQPGDLSMLAHMVQFYAEPEIIARVPSSSFFPHPAVDSAILRLRLRPNPAVAVDDVDGFFRIIKAGFLQARKKLSNALPGGLAAMGRRIPREQAIAALERAGVSPDRRAETVSLAEWERVWRALNDA